jgi:hypothetical protein
MLVRKSGLSDSLYRRPALNVQPTMHGYNRLN